LRGHRVERRTVLIVANPYSGTRGNRRQVSALADALIRHGLAPEVIWEPEERAARLCNGRLKDSCRCVVAAGGDGTVADVINERPEAPLAVLPLGSENLVAREFGFTCDVRRLAHAIVAGRSCTIDLGRAGNRLFSLMVGVGFDADVVRRVCRWRGQGPTLRRVSRARYIKHVFQTMREYSYSPVEVEANGMRVRGTHALVFNLPQYALRMPFAPAASGNDGALDWVVLQRPGLRNFLNYWWSIARRPHSERSDILRGVAARVHITSDCLLPIQIDGDAAGWTPVDIEVLPQALQVIVP